MLVTITKLYSKKKKRKSFLISFPQIKFSSQLINRINVRCNEYRVQSTEKYQRLDSASFPFPLRKDQNPRAYFSKSDRNSNSLWGWKKRIGTGFGRILAFSVATNLPRFRYFAISARFERHRINWTPKKARHAPLLRILIPLDPSTRLVGLFDF